MFYVGLTNDSKNTCNGSLSMVVLVRLSRPGVNGSQENSQELGSWKLIGLWTLEIVSSLV